MHDSSGQADSVDPGRREPIAEAVPPPLVTTLLGDRYRTKDFVCSRSERVGGFFDNEAKDLSPHYCRVFIAPNPADETEVFGYYTLSAALLYKAQMSGSDEKRASKNYRGYPAPMVRIGFMGRSDTSPKGLGAGLIVDAARRVYRNSDIAAWGLVLECEGGKENEKLWAWYQAQGFKPCRAANERDSQHSMYGPLSAFLPELQ